VCGTDKMEGGEMELKPCPFCGGTKTEVRENGRIWRGVKGYSDPVSISIWHWCAGPAGQPNRGIERVGRDMESAIASWNTRATPPHKDG
jgi:hypothetical protein